MSPFSLMSRPLLEKSRRGLVTQLTNLGLFPLCQFPLRQFPFGQLPTFVNFQFVNSHLVNVDKAGIDEVGIDKVGRFTICDNFNHSYRSFVRQWTA